MPQDHHIQAQRFELKYQIPPEIARPLREFVACYLEPDDYSVGRPDLSYSIHNLYLDSDNLHTHHATVNGDKNRFKLRLRYYDDRPGSPIFFEIKQRENDCILKKRCAVRREVAAGLLAGQLPEPAHLISREPRHLAALQRFVELQQNLRAGPRLHNHYLREAWVSPHDNSVRVTFDRNIRIEPCFNVRLTTDMPRPTQIYTDKIVLELKFTGRYPNWFRELVERFGLMRGTASKYCGGVGVLGEHRFSLSYHDSGQEGCGFEQKLVGVSGPNPA
jgi:hypothetical protein